MRSSTEGTTRIDLSSQEANDYGYEPCIIWRNSVRRNMSMILLHMLDDG